jgi:RimJ/RimL family protein N-acetyltransferase
VAAPPIEFNTARLAFRVWQDVHRPAFAAMNRDAEVMKYFPALQTREQSDASVDVWLAHFEQHGWGNWAVEILETGEFIGFIGLNIPRRQLPFSPCVEIGWRLKRAAWGHGFATEGAKECLRLGFKSLNLAEIVSFTALVNAPSIAVMRRIGMSNANADFEHPAVPEGHALRPHCLYKITSAQWRHGEA